MPENTTLACKIWSRFQMARDTGHDTFVKKADRCEEFYRGEQWDRETAARLARQRRPALTINKIKPAIENVMGEQIKNQAETMFRPRGGANDETAAALQKVYKQISDNNQLSWRRQEMFADGIITSRGFLDVRIDYGDSMTGEVKITNVNPKNVIIDPDADEYEPASWSDVMISKWFTADDIAVLYNKPDAELLRNRGPSYQYGMDAIDSYRDRFGNRRPINYASNYDQSNVERSIRVIDRQYRMLDKQKHFVEKETGDMRAIPQEFDKNRIAWFVQMYGFGVVTKLVRRIRWTVVADNVVLHDDWSPYKNYTIIPYFPGFRYGHTIGMVENLISPQENLNKIRSQELHVVNTTANSGWKYKTGALVGMTGEELQQKGAETGLAVEVNGDPDKDLVKIQPNQVPAGLDRISYKAEEDIKNISGVNDSMLGQDREDVAAKAIGAKKLSGSTNLIKPMTNLNRTDTILANAILDLVQEFYTEERVITITNDDAQRTQESTTVNQVTPEGRVVNDLTMGEYDVIVTQVPLRETSEDSQFDQAVAMKQLGVQIPDAVLIKNSRLDNKTELIKQITGDADSPEGKRKAALQQRSDEANVSKLEGDAAETHSKAELNKAKAAQTVQETQNPQAPGGADAPFENAKVQAEQHKVLTETGLAVDKHQHDKSLDYAKLAQKDNIDTQKIQLEAQAKAQEVKDKRLMMATQAAQAAQKPTTPQKG
jgi:hypothetical protein